MELKQASRDYDRVEKALFYLNENYKKNPDLKEIADFVSMSEYHFQRLFKRWAGISPKRFMQYLSKEHAREILLSSKNLLDATCKSNLSSQGRLYDLFVKCEAATPGEVKSFGEGLDIYYGVHPTTFGKCFVALTDRGICSLYFLVDDMEQAFTLFESKWKNANIKENPSKTKQVVERIFDRDYNKSKPFNLFLNGTNFQIKVWEALLRIPSGYMVSYEDVAKMIDKPKAVRAAASAIANNPISYLIPCHRVIKKMGIIHNYGGGKERKMALLGWEAAKYKNNLEQNHG